MNNVRNLRPRERRPYDHEVDELSTDLVSLSLSVLVTHGERSQVPQVAEAARVVRAWTAAGWTIPAPKAGA